MPRVLRSKSGQDREALNRELARLPREVMTAITRRMKQQGINRTELAHAMGVSPGRVSQILSGDGNLTLHTLAAVCVALDARLEAKLVPSSSVSPVTATPGVPPPVPDNGVLYPVPDNGVLYPVPDIDQRSTVLAAR